MPNTNDKDASDGAEIASRASRASDLRNLSLDPTESMNTDPESWEERPDEGDGSARYLAARPPHHGG